MDKDLQKIVISSKEIMVSSMKQLLELKKQPHPDQNLIKVIQGNYNTAKKTLEIMNRIMEQSKEEKKTTHDLSNSEK